MNRFWSKVDKHGPRAGRLGRCWVWTAYRNVRGYGSFRWEGRSQSAHRVAWMIDTGMPVPDGKYILHHCDNPPCVRRRHLFLGTHVDNMHDMVAKGRAASGHGAETHCPAGHSYDAANTRHYRNGAGRICRRCDADRQATRRQAA